tara:strand:+ start:7238 stop:7564 length:327 start_codon:yes stop_codon:yes gene_type:complete
MAAGMRVEFENIRPCKKKHSNSSYFSMVAIEESRKTVTVPSLILSTKMDIKRFIKSIIRRESEAKKKVSLNSIYKNVDEQLKDNRMKIDFKYKSHFFSETAFIFFTNY